MEEYKYLLIWSLISLLAMFYMLDESSMVYMYVSLMFFKNSNESELKGIPAIYFGYLNLKDYVQQSWNWIASVLNTKPKSYSEYLIEIFLVICGDMLNRKATAFPRLLKYIIISLKISQMKLLK